MGPKTATHARRGLRFGVLLFLIISLGLFLGLAGTLVGCSGENCLADGENCSQTYLEDNGLQGYYCCNGQVCEPGPISGVLICQD